MHYYSAIVVLLLLYTQAPGGLCTPQRGGQCTATSVRSKCINMTDTSKPADISACAELGLWFCDHVPPPYIALALLAYHSEALFISAGVFYFIALVVYFLGHVLPENVMKVIRPMSTFCVIIGYILSVALAGLHVAHAPTPEYTTSVIFALIALVIFTIKLTLHALLAIRSRSIRALSPFCNTIVLPVGNQKEHAAFALYFATMPTTLALSSTYNSSGNERQWCLNGTCRVVHGDGYFPGSLHLFSYFSQKILPLKIKNNEDGPTKSTICIYSVKRFAAAATVKKEVAKTLSERPEETAVLLDSWDTY